MEKYFKPHVFICVVLLVELIFVCYGESVKNSDDNTENISLDNSDDNGENEDSKDGIEIPPDVEQQPAENKSMLAPCNTRRMSVHLHMHPVKNATLKQFPFVASLMSLTNEHLCTGTVVSNGMLLTTGACVDQKIGYALLNTVKAKIENKDASRISVIKTEKFPSYAGKESLNNVAIVYTHKFNNSVASKLKISNYTSAQKLTELEVFGFGLNADAGRVKTLQYVGLENRFYIEMDNTIKAYIDCVEAKEPTCFRDTGGPAIFGNELVGVVVEGQDDCIKEMTANYAVGKQMAVIVPTYNFKSWLNEKIKKNEETDNVVIPTYPSKLVAVPPKKMVQSAKAQPSLGLPLKASIFIISSCMLSLYFQS